MNPACLTFGQRLCVGWLGVVGTGAVAGTIGGMYEAVKERNELGGIVEESLCGMGIGAFCGAVSPLIVVAYGADIAYGSYLKRQQSRRVVETK